MDFMKAASPLVCIVRAARTVPAIPILLLGLAGAQCARPRKRRSLTLPRPERVARCKFHPQPCCGSFGMFAAPAEDAPHASMLPRGLHWVQAGILRRVK